MSNIEKHEKVSSALLANPGEADRAIAKRHGVSPTFVGKTRRYLQAQGRLQNVVIKTGADGRKRRGRGVGRADKLLDQLFVVRRMAVDYWPDHPYRKELNKEEARLVAELAKIEPAARKIALLDRLAKVATHVPLIAPSNLIQPRGRRRMPKCSDVLSPQEERRQIEEELAKFEERPSLDG